MAIGQHLRTNLVAARRAVTPTSLGRVAVGIVAVASVWWALEQWLPRGLPIGIVALGSVFGSLYALNAIGLVLVFRASRVVNFAQAEFGSVAAVLAIQLVVQWRWPFLVALGTGLVLAAVIGAAVDALLIRRFQRAPRLIVAVVTIALAQVLAGLALVLPLLFDGGGTGRFAIPWEARLSIAPVLFNANHLLAVVVVPFVLVVLVAFLRLTDYGIAIRAAADNGDRAGLLGIPVSSLSTLVWATAGLLSALAVLLRVPIVGFTSFASVSGGGPSLLLVTLAAAVIGRMDSLPRTALAAVALGVFQEAAIWSWSNTTIVDGMLLGVIVVALLVQRDVFSRVAETGIGTWRALREVRPVPEPLRRLPEVRYAFGGLRVLLLIGAVFLPLVLSPSEIGAASLVLVYAMVAISLLVLTGWAGHISLGQFALSGFGGATTAVLHARHGWDVLLALVAGAVVGAVVALLLGLPALRIRGPFLAVTTLAFAVTSFTFFLNARYVPWFVQDRVDRPSILGEISLESHEAMYWFALIVLLLVIAGVRGLRRSRTGRVLIATRDNESAAKTVTIDTTKAKLSAFAISGAIAGLAGGVYVLHQRGLHTDAFGPEVSLLLFSMVVIGGLGSLPGAILGAVVIRSAEYFLSGGWSFVVSGAGILVLLLLLPEGLGGLVYRVRDAYLRAVAERRRIEVASLWRAGPEAPDAPAVPEVVVDPAAEPEPVGSGARV